MPRHLGFYLLIILCLSSCHQRYWHVKKVKTDKNRSIQKEKSSPEKESETRTIFPFDSLPEAQIHTDNKPNIKAPEPETNPQIIPDKTEKPEALPSLRSFKDLLPDREENVSNDEPLTFRERVLIFSIFFFLFVLFFSIAITPALIAMYLWFWFLVTPATISLLLGLSLGLTILAFVGSFLIGKKWINKKLDRKLIWDDLLGDFFFAILIYILTLALFVLFIYLSIYSVAVVMIILPYLLALLAVLYIIWWK